MKLKNWMFIPLVAVLVLMSANQTHPTVEKEEVLVNAILSGLKQLHYSPAELNDELSARIFDLYMLQIDQMKRFFTQEDVNVLQAYRLKLDDELESGKLECLNVTVKLLNTRTTQVQSYYKEWLAQPFEFNSEESFEPDAEKREYARNDAELKEYWRQMLKYYTMTRLVDMVKAEEEKPVSERSSHEALEAKARAKVLEIHDDWFHRMERATREDHLNDFLNAVTAAYDPHTNYMPPKEKEDFDINMSGRLEGIGARLVEDGIYTKVASVVPGGPSSKQGELEENDIILSVAQGKETFVSVVDMPVDEVVKFIRGKKGTEVRLTVRKVDGSTKIISIIRDVVLLEEGYAKSAVVSNKTTFGNKEFGYIRLPKFYADFSGSGGRNCADDIKKELEKLAAENVSGIILDLRNNGGGSLRDVVDMSGFFINQGPVVQVKSRGEAPYVMNDKDAKVLYGGPLVVLVNHYSASASEILAAAMQDYKRALIIGTPATFGKGTVQRFLDLDRVVAPSEKALTPLGSVKLTIQKFYRINGTTTQLNGVSSDIVLPDAYRYIEIGEKEEFHPMSWDEIAPVAYSALPNDQLFKRLKANSEERVRKSPAFKLMEEKALHFKERQDKTRVPLNLANYQAEENIVNEESKRFKPDLAELKGLEAAVLQTDKASVEADESKKAAMADWHKGIKKDFQIQEAMAVLNDWSAAAKK